MNSNARGYGHKWRLAREVFLKHNPLCVYCKKEGKVTEARVVDHIVPHKGDGKLFWSRSNWQPLCTYHHQGTKQAQERGTNKPIIGEDGFPIGE